MNLIVLGWGGGVAGDVPGLRRAQAVGFCGLLSLAGEEGYKKVCHFTSEARRRVEIVEKLEFGACLEYARARARELRRFA